MFASSWLCALSTVVIAGRFGEFRLIMRRSCLVCGHNKRQLPYNADRIIRWPIRWYSVDVGKIGRYAIIVLVTQSGFTWRCDAAHAHRILKPSSSSLEMKKKLIKICIWSVALCGSETGTVGENEERVVLHLKCCSVRIRDRDCRGKMKRGLYCIWSVALCGSETGTVGENEERSVALCGSETGTVGENEERVVLHLKCCSVRIRDRDCRGKMKRGLYCIWSVALCGSETGTVGEKWREDCTAFEAWSWRRMLKVKWKDRITNGEVFQRAKDERLLLNFFKK